jgi:SlyX protein
MTHIVHLALVLLSTKAGMIVNFEAGTATGGVAMIMPADRLTTLEIRATEQEKTIEELSGQIAEQWKLIDRLQKKLDTLAQRFLTLEEQAAPPIEGGKPPHW